MNPTLSFIIRTFITLFCLWIEKKNRIIYFKVFIFVRRIMTSIKIINQLLKIHLCVFLRRGECRKRILVRNLLLLFKIVTNILIKINALQFEKKMLSAKKNIPREMDGQCRKLLDEWAP